ncbi:MAG: porin [Pseudomonadota bacterium]
MNKSVLSLAAALLAVSGAAQAQSSVTIYGLLDVGVENLNNAKAGGGTLTRINSGGMNTSRWGLRGSEDLGGGLKAVFQLEGGLFLDTGASDGVLFKRQANVGLEGGFGKVILGRSFTSVYDFLLPFDPLGFAPSYSWATSGSATGPSKYGMTTQFDNLVKYTGAVGGFKFGATYGFGEQTTGTADSAKMATAASYAAGPVNLLATVERVNGNTVPATGERDKTTVYHLGATYENGPLKAYLVGRNYKTVAGKALTADVKANTFWTGLSYKSTEAITLTGAVYYVDVKNVAANTDADPIMYVARLRYALSKRTDVYLTGGYTKTKHNQLISLSRDDAGFGDAQHGVMAGMQHRF